MENDWVNHLVSYFTHFINDFEGFMEKVLRRYGGQGVQSIGLQVDKYLLPMLYGLSVLFLSASCFI